MQLARRSGLARTTIYLALSDKQPPPSRTTVAALAMTLALDVEPLLQLLRQATISPRPPDSPPPPVIAPSIEPERRQPGGEPHERRAWLRKIWPTWLRGFPRRTRVTLGAITAAVALLAPIGWWYGGPDGEDDAGTPAVLGDVSKADPCSLLDTKVLTSFGDTKMDTNYGEFDRCDVLVHQGNDGDAVADVNLNFASDPVEPGPHTRTEEVGHVTVAEVPSDASACVRNLQLADGNQIWIAAKRIGSPAPNLCALVQAAADHAVTVLNRGPVPQRKADFPENSLAHVDACTLLDSAALGVVPGIDAHDPHRDFSNWGCEWDSTTTDARIELDFSQDNKLTDDGQPTRLGDRKSYVAPEGEGAHSCVVHMEHRNYTDTAGESTFELVMLTAYGPLPNNELCDTAKTLATAVAKRLPKP